jgi:hypothetical protein
MDSWGTLKDSGQGPPPEFAHFTGFEPHNWLLPLQQYGRKNDSGKKTKLVPKKSGNCPKG